jgi:hypothetical protein
MKTKKCWEESMKPARLLMILVAITLFYPVLSCSLMETDAFQDLKEGNTFKAFEDIPFYTAKELLGHLSPYASIENGVVSSFNKDAKIYALNIQETTTNTTHSDLDWGISSITLRDDITSYLSKIETMISRNTLSEFIENGNGSIGDTITNLGKIDDELNALLTKADNFGYVDSDTKTAVEAAISSICTDVQDIISALQEGGM